MKATRKMPGVLIMVAGATLLLAGLSPVVLAGLALAVLAVGAAAMQAPQPQSCPVRVRAGRRRTG
jgi:hypothetical protein